MMTPEQIAAAAANAGFAGDDLITAVAVALAESYPPGNEQSIGDQGTSFGLWQIHLPAHPEFNGWNHLDPHVSALEAYSVYSSAGDSFEPWSTYSVNGKYRSFLQDAATGVAQLQSSLAPAPTPPLSQAEIVAGAIAPAVASAVGPSGTSFTQALIWAGIGLAAIWVIEELT